MDEHISDLHTGCLRAFQSLVDSIQKLHSTGDITLEILQEEYDRYILWAGNTEKGDFESESGLSFVYKIRENLFIKEKVAILMQKLHRHLTTANRAVHEQADPWDKRLPDVSREIFPQQHKYQKHQEELEDSPWEISSDSLDDGDIEPGHWISRNSQRTNSKKKFEEIKKIGAQDENEKHNV